MTEEQLKQIVEEAYRKGVAEIFGEDIDSGIEKIKEKANGDLGSAFSLFLMSFSKISKSTLYHALHDVLAIEKKDL